jgi:hypothetical protein
VSLPERLKNIYFSRLGSHNNPHRPKQSWLAVCNIAGLIISCSCAPCVKDTIRADVYPPYRTWETPLSAGIEVACNCPYGQPWESWDSYCNGHGQKCLLCDAVWSIFYPQDEAIISSQKLVNFYQKTWGHITDNRARLNLILYTGGLQNIQHAFQGWKMRMKETGYLGNGELEGRILSL